MTVAELIEILKTMPQDLPIEINDNMGGQIIYIDSVDHFDCTDERFSPEDGDYPVVMIQANVE
jgi:hypothetical protein